ncbi:MAG: thymidylate synthase [Patescibacteria group bacterium]|jgi:thymidylate synthase
MTAFDTWYQNALKAILEQGILEKNERTGVTTRSLPGMHMSLPAEAGFPLLTLRKIPIKIFIAEQIWFLSGSRKPEEFLEQYTKIWDDFMNVDGVVSTAYGYRWRHFFDRDQIGDLIALLEKEPSSRHGVVVAWDPGSDGLGGVKKKNVPCPYTFTVNIIGGKLHLHNIVRSNDMVLGFPHDVAGFALLQRLLAKRLKVGVGQYSHSVSNAHIYENHFEGAREMLQRTNDHARIQLDLPDDAYERAESQDPEFVQEVFHILKEQYHPLPAIKNLSIVL